MTLGVLRFRLTKAFPGVDSDLIEGWIEDVYNEILAVLPWERTIVHSVLNTVAPYREGTVSMTKGSNAATLTGGVWTTDMTGRAFRVTPRDEFYEFTYGPGSTAGMLDRPYEGPTGTGLPYMIFQTVYPLPVDVRFVPDDAFGSFIPTWTYGPVQRITHSEMRSLGVAFDQSAYGWGPFRWASYMDDNGTPPRIQIQLWPIPTASIGIQMSYYAEAPDLSDTNQVVQAWIRPSALIEGVTARIKRHLLDYNGAREHELLYKSAINLMMGEEAHRIGSVTMRLSDYYTSYRSRRTAR